MTTEDEILRIEERLRTARPHQRPALLRRLEQLQVRQLLHEVNHDQSPDPGRA